jgi:hypothetical protein
VLSRGILSSRLAGIRLHRPSFSARAEKPFCINPAMDGLPSQTMTGRGRRNLPTASVIFRESGETILFAADGGISKAAAIFCGFAGISSVGESLNEIRTHKETANVSA